MIFIEIFETLGNIPHHKNPTHVAVKFQFNSHEISK